MRGLSSHGDQGLHMGTAMHEPYLVEAQLRPATLVPVCLPFWPGGLAAVGGLVRLALGQAAAGVCVRELRVLLAATATAGNRDGSTRLCRTRSWMVSLRRTS